MQFSESEIKFLLQSHVEHAAGARGLAPAMDLRQLGCPARLFERVLEDRSKKLGKTFTEFRAAEQVTIPSGPATDLAREIQALKMF